jgi:hypothetical protein
MIASSIHGMRRAGLAVCAALGGAIVDGVVDMLSACVYALFTLKKSGPTIA